MLILSLLSCAGNLPLAGRSIQEAFNHDEGVVKLLKAVDRHDTKEAKRLVDSGVNVNTLGKDGATPLIWMLVRKNLPAMKLLLELGADPNQYEPNGVGTPVWLSAAGGRKEALQLLLDHGGDPNLAYGTNSPLMMAINNLHMDCAELLLQRGADINYSNGPLSAFSAAVFNVQFDYALWVLNHGYTHDLAMAKKMALAKSPRAGQEELKVKALEIIDRLMRNQ
ncbi:Ankyrin repeat [Methylobacillus rhizosphaerae]|uniref:Ankyrin repeat n=1 Tax=Methylobacillus rhizosphaerae TaxID=551994 RepID=A0A239ADZ2_9PROT|nr:Ankyrin repeat [Methylobacillus rhizosphaerae]